jgi:hypothetical protein
MLARIDANFATLTEVVKDVAADQNGPVWAVSRNPVIGILTIAYHQLLCLIARNRP